MKDYAKVIQAYVDFVVLIVQKNVYMYAQKDLKYNRKEQHHGNINVVSCSMHIVLSVCQGQQAVEMGSCIQITDKGECKLSVNLWRGGIIKLGKVIFVDQQTNVDKNEVIAKAKEMFREMRASKGNVFSLTLVANALEEEGIKTKYQFRQDGDRSIEKLFYNSIPVLIQSSSV